jgi:hypothetical protein
MVAGCAMMASLFGLTRPGMLVAHDIMAVFLE